MRWMLCVLMVSAPLVAAAQPLDGWSTAAGCEPIRPPSALPLMKDAELEALATDIRTTAAECRSPSAMT